MRRRRGARAVAAGAALLVAFAVAGLAAGRDPYATALPDRLRPPSAAHPLGQDTLGRDVLARLLHGARISLAVGATTVALSALLGVALGALGGWAGGWIDE